MNVKLLRKVKKHILLRPKRWSFNWATRSKESPCGTAACIGGWTVILGKKLKPSSFAALNSGSSDAKELLGIDHEEAKRLFFYWPVKFELRRRNDAKDGTKKGALNAASRIEHFIKTKGRE